ncbi:MAG: lipopolysaccharide assembly protein LapA domain-containing protein [Desulfohalobiaceae bacterium]|nr:lipopolysaccharide assembly protein LapA domain-containing protein [Desulfohalobiaceae bacterium]
MNYVYLILTFILVLILAILGMQNTEELQITFLAWQFQSTVPYLILNSALLGAAALGILSLPKLAKKHYYLKKTRKELHKYRDSQ